MYTRKSKCWFRFCFPEVRPEIDMVLMANYVKVSNEDKSSFLWVSFVRNHVPSHTKFMQYVYVWYLSYMWAFRTKTEDRLSFLWCAFIYEKIDQKKCVMNVYDDVCPIFEDAERRHVIACVSRWRLRIYKHISIFVYHNCEFLYTNTHLSHIYI